MNGSQRQAAEQREGWSDSEQESLLYSDTKFSVAPGVNFASTQLIFNISTSSCEPRCYRPFVVTRSQMGQFPRKAKCKIISPNLSLTFFLSRIVLPLFDTVIGLNKHIDCEYLMFARSTCLFCFQCLEAQVSKPEGSLL